MQPQVDSTSNQEENSAPSNSKPSSGVFYCLLMIVFIAIKLVNGALAIYSFIIAVRQTNDLVDEKFEGDFSVVEITYEGQKYFFAPRVSSTRRQFTSPFSLVNETAYLTQSDIWSTPYAYCFMVNDEEFARNLAGGNKEEAGLFMVKVLLACLGLFDVYDVLKGLLSRIFRSLKPRLDQVIPDNLSLSTKFYIFLLISAPRFITLNFQGDEYSICVGFKETSTLYNLFKFSGRDDYRLAPLGQYFTGIYIYAIFFCFYAIFLLGISQYFCLIPKSESEKETHKNSKIASVILGLFLCLFGIAYLIGNGLLLLAQIRNSVTILLSLVYAGRDVLEIILMGFLDWAFKVFDSFWTGAVNKIANLPENIATAETGMMLAQKMDGKVEQRLDQEDGKRERTKSAKRRADEDEDRLIEL